MGEKLRTFFIVVFNLIFLVFFIAMVGNGEPFEVFVTLFVIYGLIVFIWKTLLTGLFIGFVEACSGIAKWTRSGRSNKEGKKLQTFLFWIFHLFFLFNIVLVFFDGNSEKLFYIFIIYFFGMFFWKLAVATLFLSSDEKRDIKRKKEWERESQEKENVKKASEREQKELEGKRETERLKKVEHSSFSSAELQTVRESFQISKVEAEILAECAGYLASCFSSIYTYYSPELTTKLTSSKYWAAASRRLDGVVLWALYIKAQEKLYHLEQFCRDFQLPESSAEVLTKLFESSEMSEKEGEKVATGRRFHESMKQYESLAHEIKLF